MILSFCRNNQALHLLPSQFVSYLLKSSSNAGFFENITRQIVRHFILIAANSGMRVGELRQLRWSDVDIERKQSNGKELALAKIRVRAETSKVRTSRTLYCRGGNYFERLGKLLGQPNNNALIFSLDGKTELSKRTLLYHFHKIVELADIEDSDKRDLVPYSLRHFMITQRLKSGLNYRDVAIMCGTSELQIQRTYFHVNDEIRLTNAMKDYKRNADGTIEPV